jgi:hypothetical protein
MNLIIHPTAPKYTKMGTDKQGNPIARTVFRYIVKGTPEELKDYAAVKGEKHKTDDILKEPLFFTVRYMGKNGKLRKTSDGKDFVADDTEIAMFQSLVNQYGIDVAKVIWEKDNQKVPVEIEGKK